VSIAYIGLLALIAVTPILLFFDNILIGGAIQLCAAVGMIIVAMRIHRGEASHLLKAIQVPAALSAVPLIWMLIQLLPLSIGGLSQSIWESAASALAVPLSPSITVDPGLTVVALGHYIALIAIAFVTATVAIERPQAEKLLLALAGATALMSLFFLANKLVKFSFIDEASTTLMTAGIIGVVLFAASAVMVIERYEIRHRYRDFLSLLVVPIGMRIAGLATCSLTFVADNTGHAVFIAAGGLSAVVMIYFVRRIGLGALAALAVGVVAIVAAATIILTKGHPVTGDISLRYMADEKADIALSYSRLISEVGPGGSGAGTFRAISVIYGTSEVIRPPTLAAQIAVELGRPALWIIIGLAFALALICIRSAFDRGRDFSYPLAGAGVAMAMILDSFNNAGLTNQAISLIVAITLGLAFAQSVSRTH
jgi:hypothetical protein